MGLAYNLFYMPTNTGQELGSMVAGLNINHARNVGMGQYRQAEAAARQQAADTQAALALHHGALYDAQAGESGMRSALLAAQQGVIAQQMAAQQGYEQAQINAGMDPAQAKLASLRWIGTQTHNPEQIVDSENSAAGANIISQPGATEQDYRLGTALMGKGATPMNSDYTVQGADQRSASDLANAIALKAAPGWTGKTATQIPMAAYKQMEPMIQGLAKAGDVTAVPANLGLDVQSRAAQKMQAGQDMPSAVQQAFNEVYETKKTPVTHWFGGDTYKTELIPRQQPQTSPQPTQGQNLGGDDMPTGSGSDGVSELFPVPQATPAQQGAQVLDTMPSLAPQPVTTGTVAGLFPTTRQPQQDSAAMLQQAQDAIARGANPDVVNARLKQMGISNQ